MQAGSLGAVGVAAALARRLGRPRQAVAMAVSGTVMWASAKALKRVVGRGRPAEHIDRVHLRGQAQAGLGYPSGHAAVAANLAVVAAAGVSPATGLGMAAVAGAVGFGRVYTGAHLPLDVLGGFGIGVVAGVMARTP